MFATVAIGLLIAFDVGYYLKTLVYGVVPRLLPKVHPLARTRTYGICTTRDIDFLLNHINNARYLRAMDFGRLDNLFRTGMLTYRGFTKGSFLLAASTIRYRKPVYIFMPYRLETQIVHWDDKSIYYSQNFITLHDNFLRVTAYARLAIIGVSPEELLGETSVGDLAPLELTEDLASWMQYLKQNSDKLKLSK